MTLSAYPEYPSLAQIFGTFGAHEMAVAQSDREHKDLQHWAREVVQQIHSIPDYGHWKLVLIAPGLHVKECLITNRVFAIGRTFVQAKVRTDLPKQYSKVCTSFGTGCHGALSF